MAENWAGIAAIVAGVYLVGFWAPRRWRRRRQQGHVQDTLVQSRERERRLKESAEAIEVKLHEFARQVIATLDTKTAALKAHLDQAEALSKRLAAQLGESAPKKPVTEEKPAVPQKSSDDHADVLRLHGEGRTTEEIAATTGKPAGEILLILGLHHRRA